MGEIEAGRWERGWMVAVAAASMGIAGVVHLAIIPHHWEHAPAHGIFMGIAGVIEIAWAVAFWSRPSRRLAEWGVLIATSLITLWGITRIWPVPFGHGPEEVDTAGIVTKLLEGLSIVALFGTIFQFLPDPHARRRIWQILLAVVTLSIVLGLGIYGVARASEPLFPGLMSTESHELEEGEHGHVEPTMDMTMPMEEPGGTPAP